MWTSNVRSGRVSLVVKAKACLATSQLPWLCCECVMYILRSAFLSEIVFLSRYLYSHPQVNADVPEHHDDHVHLRPEISLAACHSRQHGTFRNLSLGLLPETCVDSRFLALAAKINAVSQSTCLRTTVRHV